MSADTHDHDATGSGDEQQVGMHVRDRNFDRLAQRCHAEALGSLTPQALARLRAARHAAATSTVPRRGLGWALATSSAAVLVLAVAMQLQRAPMDAAPPLLAATTAPIDDLVAAGASEDYQGLVAGLDENPDLYLWLAANHDTLPAPGAMTP